MAEVKTQNARVMKTTTLFLSIALVALTTVSFGITPYNAEFESCTVSTVYEEAMDMEDWMTVPFENSLSNNDLVMEDWMTVPFENSLAASDLVTEDWMSVPFESSLSESDLVLENWMVTPFETTEGTEVETWMSAAWN